MGRAVLVFRGPDDHKVARSVHGHRGPTLIVVKCVVDLEFATDSSARRIESLSEHPPAGPIFVITGPNHHVVAIGSHGHGFVAAAVFGRGFLIVSRVGGMNQPVRHDLDSPDVYSGDCVAVAIEGSGYSALIDRWSTCRSSRIHRRAATEQQVCRGEATIVLKRNDPRADRHPVQGLQSRCCPHHPE